MRKRSLRLCKPYVCAALPVWAAAVLTLLAPAVLRAQEAPREPGYEPGARTPARVGEQGFNAYLSQDAMQVMYQREMDLGELGTNAVRGGFFINEGRDLIGVADVLFDVRQRPRPRGLWSLVVGPRAYGALLSIENQDVFAVGLGGTISYFIGPRRMTSLSATAYYAPDITSFGNANDITDLSFDFETPLTKSTHVFVGYRWFRFDLAAMPGIDSGDREIDTGVHVGITYRF
ncbi:MAG TPA: YfaZ family outer membrane protein [Gammaproteobacteria bacterium]|nr:YfaZ family outer membrane protein [Gammaproteobacteria bacterium]